MVSEYCQLIKISFIDALKMLAVGLAIVAIGIIAILIVLFIFFAPMCIYGITTGEDILPIWILVLSAVWFIFMLIFSRNILHQINNKDSDAVNNHDVKTESSTEEYKMEIIDQILAIIEEHKHSGSSNVLAQALASACNKQYSVSLLAVSSSLDRNNKELIDRLARITQEPDYSNEAQDLALNRLRALGFIE